jgi:hypothetical protein
LVLPKLASYCPVSVSERFGFSELSTENNFGVVVCTLPVKLAFMYRPFSEVPIALN